MNQDQVTEEITLRKMNPMASGRILEYLIRELIWRKLLKPPVQTLLLPPQDCDPKER